MLTAFLFCNFLCGLNCFFSEHVKLKILVNVGSRELTFAKLQIILKVYAYLSYGYRIQAAFALIKSLYIKATG